MPFGLRLLRRFGHQHWIARGRDRVIRALACPANARPIHFRVPFFGHVYEGRLDEFIDWSVYFYGAYCRHELDLLADAAAALGGAGRVHFYDVGANTGHHTLFMAARSASVQAFEPFPPACAALRRRLEVNRIANVAVHPIGLGDREGAAGFLAPGRCNLGMGFFLPDDGADGAAGATALPVRRGDAYLDEQALPPLGVLKIDVEGAEAAVLAGLRGRLHADRPVILMEMSDRSRARFGDGKGLKDALYPHHRLFGVEARSVSGTYRLVPFDFSRGDEILVLPEEAAGPLSAIRRLPG